MRLGVLVLGVFLLLGGAVGYVMTEPFIPVQVWIWTVPIPNLLGVFRPLVYLFLVGGFGVALYGVFSSGGG